MIGGGPTDILDEVRGYGFLGGERTPPPRLTY
jgi:hypothetical protein